MLNVLISLTQKAQGNFWFVYACVYVLSHVQLYATPWTVAHQAPLSMGFPRQEYWSGLSFPFPGYLLHPGIKPGSPALQVDSEPPRKTSYSLEEIIVTIIFSESCYFSSVPCV